MKTNRAKNAVTAAAGVAFFVGALQVWAADSDAEQPSRRRANRPQSSSTSKPESNGANSGSTQVSPPPKGPSGGSDVSVDILSVTGNPQRALAATNVVVETAPVTVQEHGGVANYLFKNARLRKIVDLFNPKAPASLGVGGIRTPDGIGLKEGVRLASDEPRLTPTSSGSLPRTFRDDRTHEPEGIILFNKVR